MTLTSIIDAAETDGIDPFDYIDEIWKKELPIVDKINLSLELYDIQPTYHVLFTMWFNYEMKYGNFDAGLNEIIFARYQETLSNSTLDHENGMCYSLLFDIFQEPKLQMKAWNYFMNSQPTEKFLKVLMKNCLPLPYRIKEKLYQEQLTNDRMHLPIITSIFDSYIYTIYYEIEFDRNKAIHMIDKLHYKKYLPELKNEYTAESLQAISKFFNISGLRKD